MKNNKSEIEELKRDRDFYQNVATERGRELEENLIKQCDIMEYPLNDIQIIQIDKAVFELTEEVKKQSFNQGILKAKDDFIKMMDELSNPYPEDIFPEIPKYELDNINLTLMNGYKFPLDRLSAHLMRIARNNLKEELKQKIGEIKDEK